MQILHTGRYAYHPFPVAPSRAASAPINRFKPRELSSRRRATARSTDFVRCAALAQRGGLRRRRDHGIGRLLHQRVPRAAHQPAHRRMGRRRSRTAARLALEIVRQHARRGRAATSSSSSALGPRSRRGRRHGRGSRVARSRRWKARAPRMLNTGIGWHEARMPTIAGMVPRGAFGWVIGAHQGGDAAAGDRHESHQRSRRSRKRCSRAALRISCRWRGRCSRIRSLPNKAARGPRRRDQHLHRLQPGLPRSHLREQARHLPGESARRVRDGAGARRRVATPKRVARRRRRARGARLRDVARRARPSRDAVRACARDRRAVPLRARSAGQGGFPRDAALLRARASSSPASTLRLEHDGDARRMLARTASTRS